MSGICLTMIVNNEAHCIERCLNSVFQYIDFWVINDNGSTDGTQDIIKNFFKQKGIPGILNEDGWKGFSHNRSLAFQIAEKDVKCEWMYVIDADDYLTTPLRIPSHLSDADSLIITLQEGPNVKQTRQQLFKIGGGWGYAGVVHEYPYSRKIDPRKIRIRKALDIVVMASRGGARNNDPLKYWKDAIAMEKDIERLRKIPYRNLPHWEKNLEARYCYYISQSWNDFGHSENCIKWANERVKHVGFKEEVFRAYLMKARNLRKLRVSDEQIVKAIQETINYDPKRAEAYFEMAHQYVQREEWEKAWEWIKPTMRLKRPTDKLFIVEDFTYEFGAKKEASWVAYKLGHYNASYKLANDLCETYTLDPKFRSWAYNIKHKNIGYVLQATTQYKEEFKNIKCSKSKIVVNFEMGENHRDNVKSVSSFLNCALDHVNVGAWYCSKNDPEFLEKFPFFKVGKGSGDMTINFSHEFRFFHKSYMIQELASYNPPPQTNEWAQKQYEKAVAKKNKKQIAKFQKVLDEEKKVNENKTAVPKIVFLNRNGSDDLHTPLPDLFERGEGKLAVMEKVAKSPYVMYSSGEGMWSLERISCMNKETEIKL